MMKGERVKFTMYLQYYTNTIYEKVIFTNFNLINFNFNLISSMTQSNVFLGLPFVLFCSLSICFIGLSFLALKKCPRQLSCLPSMKTRFDLYNRLFSSSRIEVFLNLSIFVTPRTLLRFQQLVSYFSVFVLAPLIHIQKLLSAYRML